MDKARANPGAAELGLVRLTFFISMITFTDGVGAMLGDFVDYDGYSAIVEAVVDTEEALRLWGLEQRGLMLKTDAFGLVFVPEGAAAWDAVRLVSRGADPE